MKTKIRCDVHVPGRRREWEISSDMRVWGCCYFANGWQLKTNPDNGLSQSFNDDEVLAQRFKEDPDWNNLAVYDLDTIIEDRIYKHYIFTEGWESDNPPLVCKKECSIYYDDILGRETTKSRLD